MLQKRVNPIFPTLNDSSSAKFKKKKKSLLNLEETKSHWRRRRSKNRSWNFVSLDQFSRNHDQNGGLRLLWPCVERIVSKKMQEKRSDYVTKTCDEFERMSTRPPQFGPKSRCFQSLRINLRIVSSIQGMGASQAGFRLSASGLIKLLARR